MSCKLNEPNEGRLGAMVTDRVVGSIITRPRKEVQLVHAVSCFLFFVSLEVCLRVFCMDSILQGDWAKPTTGIGTMMTGGRGGHYDGPT